jgi:glucose 1-dehydrogenase
MNASRPSVHLQSALLAVAWMGCGCRMVRRVNGSTVVVRAWEHLLAVGRRGFGEPRTLLVAGAGPIGLLGAGLGRPLGLDVDILARTTSGPKPELVRALGGTYHACSVSELGLEPDVILECTGVGSVISQV